MAPTVRTDLTFSELDTIAWQFLRSEYATQKFSDWSLDRRVDAYLLHRGPSESLVGGSAYSALLERVMANIGPARRNGVISFYRMINTAITTIATTAEN
ncbi:hypothetical protein [Mycolicibacterium celeriflavum]|uniref:hypothetical protein n=1 Tax=Mycolicibacterium celeriflavum TaxID=1249101 RepID=UPI000AFF8907|nr:hypothetical protein [Mycolicibacterium celeriflavum]